MELPAASIILATSHAPNDVNAQSHDVIRSLVDGACRALRMVGVTLLFSSISLLQLRIFDSGFLYYGLDENSNQFIHKLYSFHSTSTLIMYSVIVRYAYTPYNSTQDLILFYLPRPADRYGVKSWKFSTAFEAVVKWEHHISPCS